MIEPGEYRIVIAHSEVRMSKSGNPYTAVTAVVIEGERNGAVLYGYYSEAEAGKWMWEEAVMDIRDLLPGLKLNARVKVEIGPTSQETYLRLGRIKPVEPPRVIHRYGSEYRFVKRLPEEGS